MEQEIPPRNRAERRKRGRPRKLTSGPAPAQAVKRPVIHWQQAELPALETQETNGHRAADIDGGDLSGIDDMLDEQEQVEHAPRNRRKSADKPVRQSKDARRKQGLLVYYGMLGSGLMLVNEYTGTVVLNQAPACAASITDLAKVNPQVAMVVDAITANGPVVAVIMAHLPIFVGTMAAFGLVPAKVATSIGLPEPPPLPERPQYTGTPDDYRQGPMYAPAGYPEQAEPTRTVPDNELPSDIEVAIREAARITGRPYNELHAEALTMLRARQQAEQANGRPGAVLGAIPAQE